jgi:N-acylglucosamine 2-epimerase
MELSRIRELIGFYENELTNNILFFWLPRCVDRVNGGYFNCFDNEGRQLISRDKYTWSQGRFVWIFSKLATMDCGTFTKAQRANFLNLAKGGRDFLEKYSLMGEDDWRCVFLMDETGNPKYVDGYNRLDMSIYADCFVIAAFAKYADAADDKDSYEFSKKLYESAVSRVRTGEFTTLPYPLSPKFRAHGIPMIFSNVTREVYSAAEKFDHEYCPELRKNLENFTEDILTNFVDENNVLREIITSDNQFFDNLLGQHANPGHTIEDMWFMIDAADILGKPHYIPRVAAITKKAFEIGWDREYGGLMHFCGINGGEPVGDCQGVEDEPMLKQLINGWGDKLWWPHSEALYTSLLCYQRTSDHEFLDMYKKVFDYTYEKFPNPDREIREWRQILIRDGRPQNKVVALPVKDPYHITRNYILIIELLYEMANNIKHKTRRFNYAD